MDSSTLTVAHLSDSHLDGEPAVRERLTRVADHLHAMPNQPDAIVVSGDITEPAPGVSASDELDFIDRTLGPDVPVLYCPGNSDDRRAFRDFLRRRADPWTTAGDQTHQVRSVGGVTFVLLDVTVPGEFSGRLEPESTDWVRETVSQQSESARVVLVMHQPPVPLGHPVVDGLRLLDSEPLEDIVRDSSAVVATLTGHTHAAVATTFGGKPLLVAPGVHSAGQLPLAYTEPNTGLIDEASPPGLAVHRIEAGRVVSYFETVSS